MASTKHQVRIAIQIKLPRAVRTICADFLFESGAEAYIREKEKLFGHRSPVARSRPARWVRSASKARGLMIAATPTCTCAVSRNWISTSARHRRTIRTSPRMKKCCRSPQPIDCHLVVSGHGDSIRETSDETSADDIMNTNGLLMKTEDAENREVDRVVIDANAASLRYSNRPRCRRMRSKIGHGRRGTVRP